LIAFLWHFFFSLLFFLFFPAFSLFSLGSPVGSFFPFLFQRFLPSSTSLSDSVITTATTNHIIVLTTLQLSTQQRKEKEKIKSEIKEEEKKARKRKKFFTSESGGLSPYRSRCLRQKLTKGCDISTRDSSLCAIDSTHPSGPGAGTELSCFVSLAFIA